MKKGSNLLIILNKKSSDYLTVKQTLFSDLDTYGLRSILLVPLWHKAVLKRCLSKWVYFFLQHYYQFLQQLLVLLEVMKTILLCKRLKKYNLPFLMSYNTFLSIKNHIQSINFSGGYQ